MQGKRRACAVGMVGFLSFLTMGGGVVRAQSATPDKPPSADRLPPVIPILPLEDATLFPLARQTLLELQGVLPRARALIDLLQLKLVLPR